MQRESQNLRKERLNKRQAIAMMMTGIKTGVTPPTSPSLKINKLTLDIKPIDGTVTISPLSSQDNSPAVSTTQRITPKRNAYTSGG